MAYRRAAVLLSLVLLTAAHPAQQPSPADQLSALLGPAVEGAVSRALAGQQQCGAEAGQRALTELGRLEGRLDAVVHGLAELQLRLVRLEGQLDADRAGQNGCRQQKTEPESEPEPKSEPESDPACEEHPNPLRAGSAPHQEPAVRACARSCLQLRDQGGSLQDGVYWLTGMPVPVLCDFTHDGGGWTLLLTAATRDGWNPLSALRRNHRSPSLTDNYAILHYADAIRDLGTRSRFAYRIEAQAEKGRRHWGGIWLAPRNYSFVHETPSQTQVSRVAKFDAWDYKDIGIEKRMPWLNFGAGSAVLTTSALPNSQWYGTLVTHETNPDYHLSPWIHPEAIQSGRVLYWLREEML